MGVEEGEAMEEARGAEAGGGDVIGVEVAGEKAARAEMRRRKCSVEIHFGIWCGYSIGELQ